MKAMKAMKAMEARKAKSVMKHLMKVILNSRQELATLRQYLGRKPQARAKTFGELAQGGIQTHTGLLQGRDAVIQMMILPTLIVIWAMTVLVIAGVVAA